MAARVEQLKAPWDPHPSPVELLTLSGDPAKGVPVLDLHDVAAGRTYPMTEVYDRYTQLVDPDSAYERLTARLQQAEADKPIPPPKPAPRAPGPEPARRSPAPKGGVDTHDLIQVGKMALRFMNTPAGREIQRSIFGVLRKRR